MKSRLTAHVNLLALLGLFAIVSGLVVMILLPDIRFAAWLVMGLGIVLMLVALLLQLKDIASTARAPRGKFGISTTIIACLFIGIVLLGNAISVNKYHVWNLTKLAEFSLTPQTKAVLTDLDKSVEAIAFLSPDNDPNSIVPFATSMLLDYQKHTDKLTIRLIDPEASPDQARRYGVTQYQTVVFQSGDKTMPVLPQEIVYQAEYAFTSAILEVTGTLQKKVYFLIGHGEPDILAADPAGYGQARQGLLEDLFKVDTLDFITNSSVPQDAAVLIIVAPEKDLSANEIAAIDAYVLAGGHILLLGTPQSSGPMNQLLAPWGVALGSGTIVDPASYATPNKNFPTVTRERNAFSLPITYFPDSTAVLVGKDVPKGLAISALAVTSDKSWLEKAFDPKTAPAFDAGADIKGPLQIGVAISTAPQQGQGQGNPGVTHIVALGNSDFASNQHYANGNNADFFLNTVDLLAQQTPLIAIRHNVMPFRRLIAGPEVASFIKYSSVALLPVLVLLAGAIVWWRRR